MDETNASLNHKLLNKNDISTNALKFETNEKREAFDNQILNNDYFDVNFNTQNNSLTKYNQQEKNNNDEKENKFVTYSSNNIESTSDSTDFLCPGINGDSNKLKIITIKNEKLINHSKVSPAPAPTKNLNNRIINNAKHKENKYHNDKLLSEEIAYDNESVLNQSILKLSQNQNFYLKTLFEKTIIKKDQYSNHKRKKLILSLMLFYIIIYFFCCCTLLIANCQPPEIIDSEYNIPFHMLDFWGSFGFALIEAAILVTADMVEIGSVRYFIVAINIGTTLVAAVLFSFNPEFWEVTCHWIEFSAQIFITLSDILFIFHQFKKAENNIMYKYRYWELGLVLVFAVAAVTKLLVFGKVIDLGTDPEQAAHFFEYAGEMVNALFAFVFTLVMYKECKENLEAIFDFSDPELISDAREVC